VYAGRLAWEKGLLVLTQAFAKCVSKIPDAQLLIAGEGPIEKSVRDLIAELGISENTKRLGDLTQDEIDEQFSGAWVQALPSLTPEPLASSAIEGMMRGHMSIASNLGGFPEVIDDGISGHLIEPTMLTHGQLPFTASWTHLTPPNKWDWPDALVHCRSLTAKHALTISSSCIEK